MPDRRELSLRVSRQEVRDAGPGCETGVKKREKKERDPVTNGDAKKCRWDAKCPKIKISDPAARARRISFLKERRNVEMYQPTRPDAVGGWV